MDGLYAHRVTYIFVILCLLLVIHLWFVTRVKYYMCSIRSYFSRSVLGMCCQQLLYANVTGNQNFLLDRPLLGNTFKLKSCYYCTSDTSSLSCRLCIHICIYFTVVMCVCWYRDYTSADAWVPPYGKLLVWTTAQRNKTTLRRGFGTLAGWWSVTVGRMTCRDRTLEFQSACKSLQGRPVCWLQSRIPNK